MNQSTHRCLAKKYLWVKTKMPHKSVLLQVQKAVQVQVDTNVRREKRQKLPALSILLLFLFKWISLHKKSEKPIFLLRALCKIKIPMPIRMQSPPPHLTCRCIYGM